VTANIVSLDRARRLKSLGTNGPEPIIAKWRCRTSGCITLVGVGQTAFDALALFNAELRRRHDRPITEHEVMFCERCAASRSTP
jgi:hypothetical protein